MISSFWTSCLVLLAGAAAVAWLAALMREKGIRPVRRARDLARKLPGRDCAILGTLALALWLVAGGKPPGGANAALTATPSVGGLRPAAPGVLPQGLRGGVLAAGALPPPPGAETNADWLAHGAHEDWFCLRPSNWWARAADGGWVEFVRVFSSGGFQAIGASGDVRDFPPPFPGTISLAPAANWGMLAGGGESLFWHAATPSNTLVLAWQDALRARSHTNLVSFRAELLNDGSVACRHGGAGAWTDGLVAPPVLPFDRDGDGLEDSVDPDPLAAGPDAHGTNAEWYGVVCSNVLSAAEGPDGAVLSWKEGVNSNAYYFVEVVAEKGPAPIRFVGDRASRLGDPTVVARGGATNRVPLLIGIGYAVTSDTPFSVSVPESCKYVEVETNGPCAVRVRWPLGFEFTERISGSERSYTVSAVPCDPGGTFEWGGTGGGGCGCGCVSYASSNVVFSCTLDCDCGNDCAAYGTYGLEGVSFPFAGGECRCGIDDSYDPSEPPPPDEPSFSVSFSRKAVIFEDAYVSAPGDAVAKRSTRVWLTVSAYGGPNGGSLTLAAENLGKLAPVASGPMVLPPNMALGPYGRYHVSFVCEGAEASDAADDVTVSGTFTENETERQISSGNSMTVFRIEIEPEEPAPENACVHRHKVGIGEVVKCRQWPAAPALSYAATGEGVFSNATDRLYICPLREEFKGIRMSYGVEYKPLLEAIEPEGIECTKCVPLSVSPQEGVGMLLELRVFPYDVSFVGIALQEVPSLNGTHTGYFAQSCYQHRWYHTVAWGAGEWRSVTDGNLWGYDRSRMFQWDQPWDRGTLVWEIPIGWNRAGTTGGACFKQKDLNANSRWDMQPYVITKTKHGQVLSLETDGNWMLNGECYDEQ